MGEEPSESDARDAEATPASVATPPPRAPITKKKKRRAPPERTDDPPQREVASTKATSSRAASDDTASNEAASSDIASNDTASNDTASNDTASNDTASNEAASNETTSNVAAPAKRKRRRARADEKAKAAAPVVIPGAGTPEGDMLREALRAFDVGDYARVRARTGQLATASDPDIRKVAAELASRIGVDPVQIVVVLACAAVLVAIVMRWVF